MREKILALLVAKFPGTRKDGLAQLAGTLSLQVATEDEATAIIEKLAADKVNNFVVNWRRDMDKEVVDSTKTFENNLKAKYDLVEKKTEVTPGSDPKPADSADIATIVANAIKAAVEPLQQKLSAFEGAKTTDARMQLVQAKFVNVPDAYKNQQLEYNKMLIGSMTDEQFNAHLTKLDGDITALNQELADKGMAGATKPVFGKTNTEGVSAAVQSYLESKSDKAENGLKGKQL